MLKYRLGQRLGHGVVSQASKRAVLQPVRLMHSAKPTNTKFPHFTTTTKLIATIGTVALGLAASSTLIKNDDKNTAISSATSPYDNGCTTKLTDLDPPTYGTLEDFQHAKDAIIAIVGEDNVATSASEIDYHSDAYFNSHHALDGQKPYMVVYPKSTAEVSEIMKVCYKYSIPTIPFAGGTSLEGHYIATTGTPCITLDFAKNMNHIIELHKDDLDVVVQPGVGWEDLDDYLGERGLLFGPDPGPGALIGGMIATSCSGTNAARYGTMKESVAGLTVVLADGTIVKTKARPRKSSAGYNLTGLVIGSEGTLGIVTEATLKLNVRPREETVAVVSFDHIEEASKTVADIVQRGIQVNAAELLDDKMMSVVNASGQTSRHWIEKPTLFFKIGGNNRVVLSELVSEVRQIAKDNNSSHFEFARTKDEIEELWEARKMALWSTINQGKSKNKDIQIWTTDVAVPISKLCQVLSETKEDINKSGLTGTLVGHAGDGNFHAFLLYTPEERPIAEKLVENMVKRAVKAEGTCTGEHGVGYGKREFLLEELGHEPIDMMRRIKIALDPKRLLNPDKVFKIDPNDKEH